MRPFARFYHMLDKSERMEFRREVIPLLGMANSTFYYRVHNGNMCPSELLKIKPVMEKYGCTKENLLSMGLVE